MLGKLLKNDIKSASRSTVFVYFALLIAIGALLISLVTDYGIGKAVSAMLLPLIAFFGFIVTIFMVFIDYRKTMFGDRGYLTNTLPVTSISLLFSKMLSSFVWVLISYIITIASLVGSIYYIMEIENGEVDISLVLDTILPVIGLPSVDVSLMTLLAVAVKIMLQFLVFVAIAFFSMTVSNVRPFQRFGLFGAIVTFFIFFGAFYFVSGKITSFLDMNLLIYSDTTYGFTMDSEVLRGVIAAGGYGISLTPVFFQMLLSVVLFIVTSDLLEKRINIK